VSYGVSIGHTEKWPGTFSLFHETLIHTIREIASWAVATGWKRLIIVNGHCGNDASLRCAVDRLRFDFLNRLHIATLNSWQLTPAIAAQFTADAKDWHANEAETSLMQFLAPDSVRAVPADDPDRTSGCIFPHMVANTSLNGVTGFPSKASAEHGASLFSEMGMALTDIVRRAIRENPPLAWERNFAA
jgi:creatinine amidohydrolase